MITALRHVLFARPQELHRDTGHLLGDEHGLPHEIVEGATPAERAAEHEFVYLALVGRQTRCSKCCGKGGFAVLRAAPDFALVGRVTRGRVHRLHRRVVQERIGVDRLDLLGRAGDGRLRVPVLVADEGLLGIEAGFQNLGD